MKLKAFCVAISLAILSMACMPHRPGSKADLEAQLKDCRRENVILYDKYSECLQMGEELRREIP